MIHALATWSIGLTYALHVDLCRLVKESVMSVYPHVNSCAYFSYTKSWYYVIWLCVRYTLSSHTAEYWWTRSNVSGYIPWECKVRVRYRYNVMQVLFTTMCTHNTPSIFEGVAPPSNNDVCVCVPNLLYIIVIVSHSLAIPSQSHTPHGDHPP